MIGAQKMMGRFFLLIAGYLAVSSLSYAAVPEVNLGEIVVSYTDNLSPQSIYKIPSAIKIYTSSQIQASGAKNIVEFLEKETALNIVDYYGTGTIVNVDMAGFADASPSNIAVLVNGRKLNPIDLSGINWTVIPLETIERIEIVQGAGAVLYGEGATSGIINIITKPPSKKLSFATQYEGGSYNYDKEGITFTAARNKFSVRINGTHSSTDGYRANSFYRSNEVFVNAVYDNSFLGKISFEGANNTYRYGLPSVLYDSTFQEGATRKGTFSPWDNAHTEDSYAGFRLKQAQHNFCLKESFFYHTKNTASDTVSWGSYGKSELDDIQARVELLANFRTLFLGHSLMGGMDYYYASYSNDTESAWSVSYTDVNKLSRAVFFKDTVSLGDILRAYFGYRWEFYKYAIDFSQPAGWPTGVIDEDRKNRERAWELGINWNVGEKTNIFTNLSRSYRSPKADEFIVQWPQIVLNSGLETQEGTTFTWGLNHSWKKLFVGLSLFTNKTVNQIYVNPVTFANENYPKVRRKGGEVTLKYLENNFSAALSYKYVNAEFAEGSYEGNSFYMVPAHTITSSLSWKILKYIHLHFISNYRSSYYILNDAFNRFPKAKPVFVAHFKMEFKYKNIQVFFGVNNLFNRKYNSLEAWSYFRTERGVYPAPERNYIFGTRFSF